VSENEKGPPPSMTRGGEEDRRRLVAHLRHELRTSLTAVIGYSEDLLETLEGAPPEVQRDLRALRDAGDFVLARINEHLGAEAIRDLSGDALAGLARNLSAACKPSAASIGELCASLLSAAEAAGLYASIPTLCRIQAAGVMLRELLEGYALEISPRVYLGVLPAAAGSAESDAGEGAPQRGRLLVADDNSVSRDVLRQWLSRQGYEVDEASGGEAALEMIREREYDLILLDLVMPDRSGLEVLEVLYAERRLGRTPIMMISALDELDGVVQCIERGADDYVSKPFNTVLLRARIRNFLELKRHRDRERAYQATLRELRGGS